MKLTRAVYGTKDQIIAQLQVEQQQAEADSKLSNILVKRREYWRGRAEGLDLAIKLLRDWAGEEEPEPIVLSMDSAPAEPYEATLIPERLVTCVCGYGPTTEEDLDQHILASMHVPGDHAARR